MVSIELSHEGFSQTAARSRPVAPLTAISDTRPGRQFPGWSAPVPASCCRSSRHPTTSPLIRHESRGRVARCPLVTWSGRLGRGARGVAWGFRLGNRVGGRVQDRVCIGKCRGGRKVRRDPDPDFDRRGGDMMADAVERGLGLRRATVRNPDLCHLSVSRHV